MFQLTVSVDGEKANWLYSIEDVMRDKLSDCSAVAALAPSGRRVYCAFGCESPCKDKMLAAVKECFVDMFAVVTKFDFIKSNLHVSLPSLSYEILLHTLVAFDRENEHKLLNKLLNIEDGMALDGYFDFRMGELKERWLEICDLTKTNCAYLQDEQTYNELLRFLISAVNPKINKLTVCESEGNYRLTGAMKNAMLDLNACNGSELMYYLIDLAPLEIVVDGGISNREISKRLFGIFDAKLVGSRKNQTKN